MIFFFLTLPFWTSPGGRNCSGVIFLSLFSMFYQCDSENVLLEMGLLWSKKRKSAKLWRFKLTWEDFFSSFSFLKLTTSDYVCFTFSHLVMVNPTTLHNFVVCTDPIWSIIFDIIASHFSSFWDIQRWCCI